MDEDNISQSNSDSNDAEMKVGGNEGGGDQEFSSSGKVFDISSDLNITPLNEVELAERAKEEQDKPVENFAAKIAAQTKNARIYREGAQQNSGTAQNISAEVDTGSPQMARPEQVPPVVSHRAFASNGPINNAPGETITVPPEVAKKYHTSEVVETKPWVKNKPMATEAAPMSPSSSVNFSAPANPITSVNPPASAVAQEAPAKIPTKKEIPLQDINPVIEKAKGQQPKASFANRLFAMRGVPKLDEYTELNPPQKTVVEESGQEKLSFETSSTKQEQKWKGNLKPMRTYEGDVAELLSKKGASTTSIALAESKRTDGEASLRSSEPTESSHAGKKIVMLLLSLILIGAGVIGAYYLYMQSPLAPVQKIVQTPSPSSLLPRDTYTAISIDGMGPLEIQYKIQSELSKAQEPETIKEVILTEMDGATKVRISGPDAIDAIDMDMPDMLRRSLGDAWMLGIYADENGNKDVFVAVTNTFFQNAFAGMLQWESVMADDIKQYLLPVAPFGIANVHIDATKIPDITNPLDQIEGILPKSSGEEAPASTTNGNGTVASSSAPIVATSTIATSTSTTTEQIQNIQPLFTIRGNFVDRIVENKDVRAFRTVEGNILFLYSFIDNQRLIVTTKESTLRHIIERIEKDSFVR